MGYWMKRVRFPGPGLLYTTSPFGQTFLAWGCGARPPSPSTYRTMEVTAIEGIDVPPCPSVASVEELPQVVEAKGEDQSEVPDRPMT